MPKPVIHDPNDTSWIVLSDYHPELKTSKGIVHPKAVQWIRQGTGGAKIGPRIVGGVVRIMVHVSALPLVDVWIERRVETADPRSQIGNLCRELNRTTNVFKPIARVVV